MFCDRRNKQRRLLVISHELEMLCALSNDENRRRVADETRLINLSVNSSSSPLLGFLLNSNSTFFPFLSLFVWLLPSITRLKIIFSDRENGAMLDLRTLSKIEKFSWRLSHFCGAIVYSCDPHSTAQCAFINFHWIFISLSSLRYRIAS